MIHGSGISYEVPLAAPSIGRDGVFTFPGESNFTPLLDLEFVGVSNAFRFMELPVGPLAFLLGVFGAKSSSLGDISTSSRHSDVHFHGTNMSKIP